MSKTQTLGGPFAIRVRLIPGGLTPTNRVLGVCDHCGLAVGLTRYVFHNSRLLHEACDSVFIRRIAAETALFRFFHEQYLVELNTLALLRPTLSDIQKITASKCLRPQLLLTIAEKIESTIARTDGPYRLLSQAQREHIQQINSSLRKQALGSIFPPCDDVITTCGS